MNEKYRSLAKRREELVVKSALQREQFASAVAGVWQPGTFLVGKNILMKSRKWPYVSGLLAILSFLFFRNRRIFSVIAAVAMTLRVVQQVTPYIFPLIGISRRIGKRIVNLRRKKKK